MSSLAMTFNAVNHIDSVLMYHYCRLKLFCLTDLTNYINEQQLLISSYAKTVLCACSFIFIFDIVYWCIFCS